MKNIQDAFGQEMWAYFKGKDSYEIIERDDGYFDASSGPPIYFSDFKDWPELERKAMRSVRGRVLDVGCGAGRHSLYLQKRGHDVLGIDNSPLAVKICRLRGLRKVTLMSITQVDFGPNAFDTIIMLDNNFGLFGGPRRAKSLLREFHAITSRNARIIAESNDPYKTKNPDHLMYHEFNRRRGRMPGQLRLRVRFGKYVGDWFDYLIVSRNEMKQILKGTGWKVKNFLSTKDNAHIRARSPYIAIIEKA
jgi:SAM-dependent methyltransferase